MQALIPPLQLDIAATTLIILHTPPGQLLEIFEHYRNSVLSFTQNGHDASPTKQSVLSARLA